MPFWMFLLAVWIFAEWMFRRRDRQRSDERFANVISTLNRTEADFKELKKLTARVAELEKQLAAHPTEKAPVAAVPPPAAAPAAAVHPPRPEAPHEPVIPPAKPAAPASTQIPPPRPVPPSSPIPPGPASHVTPARPAPSGPGSFAPPAAAQPRREVRDIEQALGTNWLNKIGIAVLVIGIALFLAYKFPTLSNPEKVGLGYAVSFGILGLGVFLERKDLYRIFARALIGGGWALVFFTTYAMYFVKYTQVIQTEWIDLVILFAVAWLMVLHTLRYNSQVVTGLAFLLGFTTVAISQNTVYCLAAGAILAFGLVAIVHKRGWFELEIFGLIASYLNHYVWLRSVIEPMGSQRHMFPEFFPSAALLCTYWALYRWSYIARRIQTASQEHISTAAALLNTGFLLFLFKYQSVRPELAFYALLVLGAIELTLGQLPVTRKRRTAMTILSTIGIVLLVAAVPFKYSGMGTAILWLAEAETLIFVGVLTRETLFRQFGFLSAVLTLGDMLYAGAEPIFETRMGEIDLLHSAPEYRIAVTFLFAGLLFFVDAEWIPKKWRQAIQSDFEEILFRAISYLGGFALFVGLWLAFPNLWTAVAWSAAGLALAIAGRAANAKDLSHQANWLGLAGFFAAMFVNIDAASSARLPSNIVRALSPGSAIRHGVFHFDVLFITVALVVALLYACAFLSGPTDSVTARIFSAIHTWTAITLLLALTMQETSFPWLSVIWAFFGLLLLIAAGYLKRSEFSLQAALVSAFAVVLTLTVNLSAPGPFSLIPSLSIRLVTMALTASFLYASAWWCTRIKEQFAAAFASAYSWAGSFLVWMLLLYEVRSLDVALAWVVFGVALFECEFALSSFNLRLQSYFVFASALFRVFYVNVEASPHDMAVATLPLALAFYYVHWRSEMQRDKQLAEDRQLLAGQLIGYFGTTTVATVLYFGLDAGWVGTGWAVLALLLIAVAWAAEHNVLLHHSLLLAGAVLVRTVLVDLPQPLVHDAGLMQNRSFHVSAACAALFACLAFAFPLRKRIAAAGSSGSLIDSLPFVQRPEQVFFFVPLALVTALIARDVSEGRVTMAWGIEAVVVFMFALLVGERSFRLTGLGLLLLCVGKIVLLDVWRQNKADRFTTFIILGIALLLVSFLYTRYSSAIRRYL